MRLHRFYVKQPLGEELVVDNVGEGKEVLHQWSSVFRYSKDSKVILFSSYDTYDYTYSIVEISKKEARLLFVSKTTNIQPRASCALYMALVKKDTFETVVRQATELGITEIIPVLADRSEKKNLNFERLEAIAIEASEQSGRGSVPVVHPIISFTEALSHKREGFHVFGSLHGKPASQALTQSAPVQGMWIGPEGGWSEKEEEMALASNLTPVQLTETTLKADTACVTLLSLVLV
jgi:16S rRNA (uracil1498-N3)-methyltransferase